MKLKLRVDQDDLLIFGVFALFLLYIVAIGVLNLQSVVRTGTFSGLNPFPAFGPDNIGKTVPIYLIFLIGIFFTVKDYIFEPDSGIGITTEKKDKGYSRWAKDREVQNDEDVEEVSVTSNSVNAAGVPLMIKHDKMWVDNGDYHTLVIGSTGSGKTQTVLKFVPFINSYFLSNRVYIINDIIIPIIVMLNSILLSRQLPMIATIPKTAPSILNTFFFTSIISL